MASAVEAKLSLPRRSLIERTQTRAVQLRKVSEMKDVKPVV